MPSSYCGILGEVMQPCRDCIEVILSPLTHTFHDYKMYGYPIEQIKGAALPFSVRRDTKVKSRRIRIVPIGNCSH